MTATFDGLAAFAAVDPVPWARAQMAFTLVFHIILVPLGVSWAFMTLIANYRAVRHDDRDALMLAQRWSKYMAVTFAVGAVTGTVLSFEFGLLWPRFMGQWGEAFGVPFAFEGLFFFTEAIFIAIYIFGWRRLKPWAHFWTGVPIVLAGIFGSVSVVAANAWMNAPSGFTLDSDGDVVDVDPIEVIFNDSMPLQAAHMVIAAYLVGGFLVASVYATGMLRGRRDRYHHLGFVIAFTVAAVATPIQMGVGDSLARWVYNNQPAKFAAIELVPDDQQRRPRDPPGPPQRGRHGQRRHRDPRPGLVAVRPQHRHGDGRAGPGRGAGRRTAEHPADQHRPPRLGRHGRPGDAAVPAVRLVRAPAGYSAAECRRASGSCGPRPCSGVLAVIAMEAGWIVTEVGRQPWIVYNHMKVEDAATGNTGVWITFVAVVVLYIALGITTILVLRGMSRRFRRAGGFTDHDAPYGPSEPPRRAAAERGGGGPVSTAVADRAPAGRGGVRGLRGRRLRGRVLGPHGRRGRAGGASARRHRTLDRSGVGSQPCLVDLHLRRLVDVVPRGLRLDHADPVRAPDHRGSGHRAARRELRIPEGGRHHTRPAHLRRRVRHLLGAGAVLHGSRSPAASRPAGCQPVVRPATRWTAGSTRPPSSAASWPWRRLPTWPPSTWSGTPGGWVTPTWPSTSGGGPWCRPSSSPSSPSSASSCFAPTRPTSSTASRLGRYRW